MDQPIKIEVSGHFSWQRCLEFLDRSAHECLHQVNGATLFKVFDLTQGPALMQVEGTEKGLNIISLNRNLNLDEQLQITRQVRELLDLDRDLTPFYKLNLDSEFADLVSARQGLRIIAIPDLFEALCWSVIGQQINLTFAYRLKQRLVQHFKPAVTWGNQPYYTFPKPIQVLSLSEAYFRSWQFSGSKYRYIQEIAAQMDAGSLSKSALQQMDEQSAYERLLDIKGIGPWSAHYVQMKCLQHTQAYPKQDVGLHNALRQWWDRKDKPTAEELDRLGQQWHPWQGYMTFYLWHSLLSN